MVNKNTSLDLFKYQNTAPNFLDIRRGKFSHEPSQTTFKEEKRRYCQDQKWAQKGQHGNRQKEVSNVNKERHRNRSD